MCSPCPRLASKSSWAHRIQIKTLPHPKGWGSEARRQLHRWPSVNTADGRHSLHPGNLIPRPEAPTWSCFFHTESPSIIWRQCLWSFWVFKISIPSTVNGSSCEAVLSALALGIFPSTLCFLKLGVPEFATSTQVRGPSPASLWT